MVQTILSEVKAKSIPKLLKLLKLLKLYLTRDVLLPDIENCEFSNI